MTRLTFAASFAALLLSTLEARAQSWLTGGSRASTVTADQMPRQVISTGPIGLVIDLVNAEYEVRVNDSVTVGAGASRLAWGTGYTRDKPYTNGDAFVRYYPTGTAFNGFSFGVKAGYTHLPGDGSFMGVGFDANHSVMLNRHFYVSTGLGMKRLLQSADGSFGLKYIPTLRWNVGIGF